MQYGLGRCIGRACRTLPLKTGERRRCGISCGSAGPLLPSGTAGSVSARLRSAPASAQETIVDPKAVAIPHFVDDTANVGIDSVYKGEWQYMVGGGVAAFDCAGDGLPSLFFAGGEAPGKFYRNVSARGGAIRLSTRGQRPRAPERDRRLSHRRRWRRRHRPGVVAGGGNVLMRGLGGCRFERANEPWGFEGGDSWSTAFAATWERGAPWPTFAIGNYINRHEEIAPWGTCTDNWLFRPAVVDGAPQRKFAPPLTLKPSFCSLSMLFSDWNKSGTPSLRVANDREYYDGGQEQLWRIEPGKAAGAICRGRRDGNICGFGAWASPVMT